MRTSNLIIAILLLTVAALAGCGGGGSTPQTVLTGVVMAGPVAQATVTAFSVTANGTKGDQLAAPTTTSSQGIYSINVGNYTGAVLLEVTGGSYTDEATGAPRTIAATLRAAVMTGSGTNVVNVTPLTELAVQKMPALNATAIASVNKDIGDLFKIPGITTTTPVVATGSTAATAPTAQKEYGLVLAALSQTLANQGTAATLETMLAGFAADVTLTAGQTPASLGSAANGAYKLGMADFLVNPRNLSGITTLANAPFNANAAKIALLRISTGTLAENVIGADFSFNLPVGASIGTTGSSTPPEAAAGTVVASGVAVNGVTTGSTYAASTRTVRVLLAEANGFGAGELATVAVSLAAGSTLTETDFQNAAAFVVTKFARVSDGAALSPAPTLTLTATIF